MTSTAREACQKCRDTGWVIETRDGRELAVRCHCRKLRAGEALLASCRIPSRYAVCSLENFDDSWDPSTPSYRQALQRTIRFATDFPEVTRGLLFQGPAGIGKTHLAIAALRKVVVEHKVRGLYVNFVELTHQLQLSFDGSGPTREEIIAPVVGADVVVLDDLGAGKATEWTMDLLYLVVNRRYMENKLTLATTNFRDVLKGPGSKNLDELRGGSPSQVAFEESLTDRVGARVRSRLYEMCEYVDLRPGSFGDYRSFRKLQEGRR